MTPAPKALRGPLGHRNRCGLSGAIGRRWKWLGLRELSGVRYPDEPLSFEVWPAQQEPQHRLPQLRKLPPRWRKRRSSIRTHQRAINSAVTALCSRSRTPARWSTVKLVRQAGVNSGSKRLAKSSWLPQPHAGSPSLSRGLSHDKQPIDRSKRSIRPRIRICLSRLG
jgi:hypothetical protein